MTLIWSDGVREEFFAIKDIPTVHVWTNTRARLVLGPKRWFFEEDGDYYILFARFIFRPRYPDPVFIYVAPPRFWPCSSSLYHHLCKAFWIRNAMRGACLEFIQKLLS